MMFRAVVLSLALSLAAFGIEPVSKARIDDRAKSAKTPEDHAAVAVMYRECAVTLQKNAELHEAEAKRLVAKRGWPVTHKWPALAPREVANERELAAQARRDAGRCTQAAVRHSRLSLL